MQTKTIYFLKNNSKYKLINKIQWILICLFCGVQMITAQDITNYYYGPEGKEIFTVSKGHIAVKFKENFSKSKKENLIARVKSLKAFNEDQIFTYSNDAILSFKEEKNQIQTQQILKDLQKTNDFLYVSPLLLDKNRSKLIVTEQIAIRLKHLSDYSLLEDYATSLDLNIIAQDHWTPTIYFLKTTPSTIDNSLEVANYLYETGDFKFAEPIFFRLTEKTSASSSEKMFTPSSEKSTTVGITNDPYIDDQWYMENEEATSSDNLYDCDIDVNGAWANAGRGSSNIKIAVLDEGVDLTHDDLTPNLLPGFDATDEILAANGGASEDDAHGTACAGIIAAVDNNGEGISGIAPNCKMIPVRIAYGSDYFVDGREQWTFNDLWTSNAINWSWDQGNADILSNSWGGGSNTASAAIANAVTMGRNGKGCPVLFSAGNSNAAVKYPASDPNTIAVGAMSPCCERKSPTSCDGESWWGTCYGEDLDVAAPGVLMATTDISGNGGYASFWDGNGIPDYLFDYNGTSSACPVAAGVMALILSKNPNYTEQQARWRLENSCVKPSGYSFAVNTNKQSSTWNNEVGYGMVNAFNATNFGEPPLNDVCENATTITCNTSPFIQLIPHATGAGFEGACGTNITGGEQGVWYKVQGTGLDITITGSRFALYGGTCGNLTCISTNGTNYTIDNSVVGTTYYIYATNDPAFTGVPNTQLSISCEYATNNICSSAERLYCGDFVTGTINSASGNSDYPGTCGSTAASNGNGLWYIIEGAGYPSDITVSTCNPGTNFDTQISVWEFCINPVCIAGTDDGGCDGTASSITFSSTIGTDYLIYVHGYNTSEGNFELSVNCETPINDICSQAIEIGCADFVNDVSEVYDLPLYTASNIDYPGACGDVDPINELYAQGVWYHIVGNGSDYFINNNNLEFNTDIYDIQVSIWSGDCNNLSCVKGFTFNNNYRGTWFGEYGVDYYLYVYTDNSLSVSNNPNREDLSINCEPYNNYQEDATNIYCDDSPIQGSTLGASFDVEINCGDNNNSTYGVWYSVNISPGQSVAASLCNSTGDLSNTLINVYDFTNLCVGTSTDPCNLSATYDRSRVYFTHPSSSGLPSNYYIYVYSKTNGDRQNFELTLDCINWGCTNPQAHNYQASATYSGPCETCSDGVQNGDEEAIDCGGTNPNCSPCTSAQLNCINTYEWPSGPIPIVCGSGAPVTVVSNQWGGEFVHFTNINPNSEITFSNSGSNYYLQLRKGTFDGPLMATGTNSITFLTTSNEDLFLHISPQYGCELPNVSTTTTYECALRVCDELLPISCSETISSTTTNNFVRLNPCGSVRPARVFDFIPDVSREVNITLSNFTGDLNLFAYNDICNSCSNFTSSISGNPTETITFFAAAGKSYQVLVWGEPGVETDFDLTAECGDFWSMEGTITDENGIGEGNTEVCVYSIPNINECIMLDGSNDYVNLDAIAGDMANSIDFTFEAWINVSTTSVYPTIFAANGPNGNLNTFLLYLRSGKPALWVGSQDVILGTNSLVDGQWHHIAYKRASTVGTLLVDGQIIGTHTPTYTFTADNLWSLGQEWDNTSPSDFFIGKMDEVRIWNTALSDAQINANKDKLLNGDETSLIAYYRFDGNIANDMAVDYRKGIGPNLGTMVGGIAYTSASDLELPYCTMTEAGTGDYIISGENYSSAPVDYHIVPSALGTAFYIDNPSYPDPPIVLSNVVPNNSYTENDFISRPVCGSSPITAGQIVWLGCVNKDWHVVNNWNTKTVPQPGDIVYIPPNANDKYPAVSTNTNLVGYIYVYSNASLKVIDNGILNIGGTGNGTGLELAANSNFDIEAGGMMNVTDKNTGIFNSASIANAGEIIISNGTKGIRNLTATSSFINTGLITFINTPDAIYEDQASLFTNATCAGIFFDANSQIVSIAGNIVNNGLIDYQANTATINGTFDNSNGYIYDLNGGLLSVGTGTYLPVSVAYSDFIADENLDGTALCQGDLRQIAFGCEADIILVGPADNFTNNASEMFQTNRNIIADNQIAGNSNVTYDAGLTVELNSGFEINLGSEFTAIIDGCDDPPALNLMGDNDYIVASIDELTTGNSSLTIETWIYPDALPVARSWPLVLGQYNTNNIHWLYNPSGSMTIGLWGVTSGQMNIVVPIQEWTHIASVFTNSMMTVYVNGISQGTVPAVLSLQNTNIHLGRPGNLERYFNGSFDELRIWNIARTEAQIQSNYSKSLNGSFANLIACYSFNEGMPNEDNSLLSSTVNDVSGNENHGSMNNFLQSGNESNWVLGPLLFESLSQ